MTEAEWLESADHQRMLDFLRKKSSDRKLRLFACACCWHILTLRPSVDKDIQSALIKVESLADGTIDQEEALQARRELESVSPFSERWCAVGAVCAALDGQVFLAAECAASHSVDHFGYSSEDRPTFLARLFGFRQTSSKTAVFQPAPILRDIFGNPFRSVSITPACRARRVIATAEAIYNESGFTDLSSLADALEDAGCTNADILAHCRGPGPHVRGCWVIDLLLGKS